MNKIKINQIYANKIESKNDSTNVVVFSSYFKPSEKNIHDIVDINNNYYKNIIMSNNGSLTKIFNIVKDGGLIFVYSTPKFLPYYGEHLNYLENKNSKLLFKYWIALDLDSEKNQGDLYSSHLGLLMYLKINKKRKTPNPFHLNTKTVRVPYKKCKYCNRITKDWGGKKHLMNPLGAALSDVWRDFSYREIKNHILPDDVIKRIYKLTEFDKFDFVHIIQNDIKVNQPSIIKNKRKIIKNNYKNFKEVDTVILGDACQYMKKITKKYPQGLFDLVFADPPYNLEKNYNIYTDKESENKYIKWSIEWLNLMAKILRPGGTLMVLNLPKWCIYYATFLNKKLQFNNWIVWDSMSTPSGKLMPAHYALLYYTKPGGNKTFNYTCIENYRIENNSNNVFPIDSDDYCLYNSCIKKRKQIGEDKKIELSDIWWDIHRIKHKKDRDKHPCQLPLRLMERIIKLTTNEGDLIFDPFSGTGTTAIAAKILGRHFVTVDVDKYYVDITKKNLSLLQPTITGKYRLERNSLRRIKKNFVKKDVEISYLSLCIQNKKRDGKVTLQMPNDIFDNTEDTRKFNEGKIRMLLLFVEDLNYLKLN